MEPTTVKGMVAGVGTAAAVVLLSAASCPSVQATTEVYNTPSTMCYSLQADSDLCDFDLQTADDRYNYFASEDVQLQEQLNVIVDFSKRMIENSKDIEPEIVALVDEHFWDLI